MTPHRLLFVCVHNAGRSQMAAAFARALGGSAVEVVSAGSAPAERIHPGVLAAMREVGIDLAAEQPTRLTDQAVEVADVAITMGCGDACPVFPGTRYEDWALDDPAGRGVEEVRPVRDAILERVRRLLEELGVPPRPLPSVDAM